MPYLYILLYFAVLTFTLLYFTFISIFYLYFEDTLLGQVIITLWRIRAVRGRDTVANRCADRVLVTDAYREPQDLAHSRLGHRELHVSSTSLRDLITVIATKIESVKNGRNSYIRIPSVYRYQ